MMALSALNQRRWRNFKANRRAFWSLWLLLLLYGLSLFAELIANDRPVLVRYDGGYYMPVFKFYPEVAFGGDLRTEADYTTPEVKCLIVAAGSQDCWDDPEGIRAEVDSKGTAAGTQVNKGWMLWPPIPYRYNTIVDTGGVAPGPPSAQNWLGTDDTSRDVLARVIYGFRLSVTFALIVTVLTSVIGIAAGAVQGYFGGLTDLLFQRFIELWSSVPTLYVIIILTAVWAKSFWLLVG
jgi:microcin C transport system permease protein